MTIKLHFPNTAALLAAHLSGALAGRVLSVAVEHDDECTPECCCCEPSYSVEDATPEAIAAGQRAQRAWVRSSRRAA